MRGTLSAAQQQGKKTIHPLYLQGGAITKWCVYKQKKEDFTQDRAPGLEKVKGKKREENKAGIRTTA